MRTIHKKMLDVCDVQIVELPGDYKLLHLAMQHGTPCLWYECETDSGMTAHEVLCFGTGHRLPAGGSAADGALRHIGSVVDDDGLVWHYYFNNGLKMIMKDGSNQIG